MEYDMSIGAGAIPLLYPKSNILDTATVVIKCKDGYQVSYCDNEYYQQIITFKTKKEVKQFIDSTKYVKNKKCIEDIEKHLQQFEDDEVLDNWATEQARKTTIGYSLKDLSKKTFTCKGCGAPALEDVKCKYCGNINYKE
jgi:DNA phosphorothioation-dependent restriction protein DptG